MQVCEFLAEVRDRQEEALRKHGKRGENTESQPTGENPVAAGPIDQGDGGEAEKFDGRIEESVSENRVAPSEHIVAIALLEFFHGFALAIEELHDAHSGNVFLEKSLDASNSSADSATRVP